MHNTFVVTATFTDDSQDAVEIKIFDPNSETTLAVSRRLLRGGNDEIVQVAIAGIERNFSPGACLGDVLKYHSNNPNGANIAVWEIDFE